MQQAIPYKSWPLPCVSTTTVADNDNNKQVLSRSAGRGGGSKDMAGVVSENAVIVFAKKGCCMSHVARRLLLALGVNPVVYEIDEEEEVSVLNELAAAGMICKESGSKDKTLLQLPAVFIGGRLFGGLDKVMATHISGELVSVLKDAGALWL